MVYFAPKEFVCKCGVCTQIPSTLMINTIELMKNLDAIRERVGVPVIIDSAIRCEAHNDAVGGKKDSQHLLGKAADIRTLTLSPSNLAKVIRRMRQDGILVPGGLGTYSSFIHFDTGPERSWVG